MISGSVSSCVHAAVASPLGGKGSGSLPYQALLIFLARENSDAYLTDEAAEIPEGEIDWGYALPTSLFSVLGEGLFFTAGGEPIVKLKTEIAAAPGINTANVLFNATSGKLAVYHPVSVLPATLTKAKKVLKIT